MHGEGHRAVWGFWWIIVPVCGMAMAMARMWMRHSQANRTIDIIKSYIDQGKEPPPELLVALRDPNNYRRERGWVPVFLFGAMAIAFLTLGLPEFHEGFESVSGLVFVAIIMAGLCIGNLFPLLSRRKRDQDRKPLQ